ncbi:hypothetical protein FRC14_008104 [Serendipita sp. 396]|nr:hypothetical protein FRC14_008104 [Serendipita sp. 396]KAG8787073.1 hypothetical protein FRC15_010013 [Serendipita sp. 397]KAG8828759.1 hypothetical protein FRC19_000147 [Serendipita sp. 401]KAG8850271.1 hypothetical protein FRB91_009256 [Serendipita sp. 411]KAG8870790.1 hypothetical protein FRC20_011337 [Serendipita sp. 405]
MSAELLGVAQDGPEMSETSQLSAPAVPKVSITFLLLSGKRRTFEFDHTDTIGSIKERLVHEWPAEWEDETRPQGASSIRLLMLGRLLGDEEVLSDNPHFELRPAPPTVIHLSVRPFPAKNPSSTGSFKHKASLLRSGNAFNFPNRANTASQSATTTNPAGEGAASHTLDSVPEQESRGCCGCIIC